MYNIANVGWQLVHGHYSALYSLRDEEKRYWTRRSRVHYRFSSSRKLYSGLAAIQYLYNVRLPIMPDLGDIMYVYR